jgi:transposase
MIPTEVRIFVCSQPVDMRLGFDRLAQVARDRVGRDPVAGGALFVFAGKSATRLKVLWFDRNGLCMLYKRLHQAVFELPAAAGDAMAVHIDSAGLARLLAGAPRAAAHGRERKSRGDQPAIA